jgi:predicted nucleic acid-binding protein
MEALLRRAREVEATVLIPSGVLAQVFTGEARQVPLQHLLRRFGVGVPPLDRLLAEAVGRLLRRTRTTDVVDASVAVIARQAGAVVVTSDADDLRVLDASLPLEQV